MGMPAQGHARRWRRGNNGEFHGHRRSLPVDVGAELLSGFYRFLWLAIQATLALLFLPCWPNKHQYFSQRTGWRRLLFKNIAVAHQSIVAMKQILRLLEHSLFDQLDQSLVLSGDLHQAANSARYNERINSILRSIQLLHNIQ